MRDVARPSLGARGLKQNCCAGLRYLPSRAPFTGCAWIETHVTCDWRLAASVARPSLGARGLKPEKLRGFNTYPIVARPSLGARGLKQPRAVLRRKSARVARPSLGARGLKLEVLQLLP